MVWLGEGRKLTQTGRIGLADARHVVEVLGTGDKVDPEIGERVFKTTSSEQLPPQPDRGVDEGRAARQSHGYPARAGKNERGPDEQAARSGAPAAEGLSEAR